MKCKTCGATARTLKAMAAHYRKKHPSAMRRSTRKTVKPRKSVSTKYCSKCGQPI